MANTIRQPGSVLGFFNVSARNFCLHCLGIRIQLCCNLQLASVPFQYMQISLTLYTLRSEGLALVFKFQVWI